MQLLGFAHAITDQLVALRQVQILRNFQCCAGSTWADWCLFSTPVANTNTPIQLKFSQSRIASYIHRCTLRGAAISMYDKDGAPVEPVCA
jgi:hypothetical protein